MTKDEEIRINATLAEMGQTIMRANARAADLAAECASLNARLQAANEELAKLKPAPTLQEVK